MRKCISVDGLAAVGLCGHRGYEGEGYMVGRALGLILVVCATGWTQELRVLPPPAIELYKPGFETAGTTPKELYKELYIEPRLDPIPEGKAPIVIAVDGLAFREILEIPIPKEPDGYLAAALKKNAEPADARVAAYTWSRDPGDTKEVVKDLKDTIKTAYKKAKEDGTTLSIVAHSWGTVLAHDALAELAKEEKEGIEASKVEIAKFTTMGSPLEPREAAVAAFKYIETRKEDLEKNVQKPGNVTNWVNVWADGDILSGEVGAADANIKIDPDGRILGPVGDAELTRGSRLNSGQLGGKRIQTESSGGTTFWHAAYYNLEFAGKHEAHIWPEKVTESIRKREEAALEQRMTLRDKARREFQRDMGYEGRENRMALALKIDNAITQKTATDAHGNRVRIEAYILRPKPNQVQNLVLNTRADRFDYMYMLSTFFGPVSGLAEAQRVVNATFGGLTAPANYLTDQELVATNTADRVSIVQALGAPLALNYGAALGWRFYPSTLTSKVRLSGPGYNVVKEDIAWSHNGTQYNFTMKYPNAAGVLANYANLSYTPSTGVCAPCVVDNTVAPVRSDSFGSDGSLRTTWAFKDGTFFGYDTWQVKNDGTIIPPWNPSSPVRDPSISRKDLNLEVRYRATEFRGRDIDIVVPSEMFQTSANGQQDVRPSAP